MRYVDEFRDKRLIDKVAAQIRRAVSGRSAYRIMEVCGTHTMNIFRFGLRDILPENIKLISGPGCPVCVTPAAFIDKAIALARMKGIIVATFGDMLKVPGSRSSLEAERSRGADITAVYSTMDALSLAKKNPDKDVVFLGIGFETTIPTVAQSILIAREERMKNYSVLCGHKTMPEILACLTDDEDLDIDGILLPGHVSAVIGLEPYEFLAARRRGKRCVVAGFEPLDIMQAVLMLVRQARPKVEIQYNRVINRKGNARAQHVIARVFRKTPSEWRGIGIVKNSGLKIRDGFSAFDAEDRFRPKIGRPIERKGCICGDVLKGVKTPIDCKLFGRTCAPDTPVGACMVSSEGACAAYYKYGGHQSPLNKRIDTAWKG